MDNMLVYAGPDGAHEARVSLTAPAPAPPRPHRPSSEVYAERVLQAHLVDAMTRDILPKAEKSRDALREAFGKVEARVAALGTRIVAAHQDECARQVADGQAPQWGLITPQGASAAYGLSALDRLLVEAQSVKESEWTPANNLWMAQESHLSNLKVRLSVEQQKLAALDGELAAARAAESLPAPDPERPGGRLFEMRRTLTAMGVPLGEKK